MKKLKVRAASKKYAADILEVVGNDACNAEVIELFVEITFRKIHIFDPQTSFLLNTSVP